MSLDTDRTCSVSNQIFRLIHFHSVFVKNFIVFNYEYAERVLPTVEVLVYVSKMSASDVRHRSDFFILER